MPTLSERARDFDYVREYQAHGQNHGARVNGFQVWGGGKDGDSWCAFFVTFLLDVHFKGRAPIPRTGSCEEIRALAAREGWLTATPSVDDLFLYVDATGRAHHVGIVTGLDPLDGIAGNTSKDGTSANGDGVYEHEIVATLFVHWPREWQLAEAA